MTDVCGICGDNDCTDRETYCTPQWSTTHPGVLAVYDGPICGDCQIQIADLILDIQTDHGNL